MPDTPLSLALEKGAVTEFCHGYGLSQEKTYNLCLASIAISLKRIADVIEYSPTIAGK